MYDLKGLYHRRVFIQVCLQIDPESYEWGLSARSVGREMKSTATNDNMRVKHTTLRYFKRVAIFRGKHYPNRSVRDALRICYFNITISKWIRPCNFVQVKVLKNIDFNTFTKMNFNILICDKVSLIEKYTFTYRLIIMFVYFSKTLQILVNFNLNISLAHSTKCWCIHFI